MSKNRVTPIHIAEFNDNYPLKIGKVYIVNEFRLSAFIKTNNILSITAYPTKKLREDICKRDIKITRVGIEIYRKQLVEIGLFQTIENKIRKAENNNPIRVPVYKLAKKLLLEASK